jgi:hypothetical protein
MKTDEHGHRQQTLLKQLAQMTNLFLEGVSDLTEDEMDSELAPATRPNEALRLAMTALDSTIPLFRTWDTETNHEAAAGSPRVQFRRNVRLLLNSLAEAEPADLDRALVEPFEVVPDWPPVATAGEAIWSIIGSLAILDGDISVARVALGKQEQSWQRDYIF